MLKLFGQFFIVQNFKKSRLNVGINGFLIFGSITNLGFELNLDLEPIH